MTPMVLRLAQVTIHAPDRLTARHLAEALPAALQQALTEAVTGSAPNRQAVPGVADRAAQAILGGLQAELRAQGRPVLGEVG